MQIRQQHQWNVSPKEAIAIQKTLCLRLHFRKLPGKIRCVAGADVSFSRKSNMAWAGVVVLKYPSLDKVEERWIKDKVNFPYIPGLLSFREIPHILEVFKRLKIEPDLIFCDGQGIAHPRGLGLASHLGFLTGKPTIGCAKTRLVGEFSPPGRQRGDLSPLFHKGREVGVVLRTKTNVKPLFISPGYAVTIKESIRMVLDCGRGYRIPEPVRQAHLLVNQARSREEGSNP